MLPPRVQHSTRMAETWIQTTQDTSLSAAEYSFFFLSTRILDRNHLKLHKLPSSKLNVKPTSCENNYFLVLLLVKHLK